MSVLLSELDQGVLTLTLNRPEAINAFNTAMLQGLAQAMCDAAENPEVRAVVVRGAGRGFCSGQDLREFEGKTISYKAHLKNYAGAIAGIATLDKPVIAAVHGAAAGAGLSLALACDLRIAASDAVLTTGFSRIALIPDAGMSYHLPRIVGQAKAFELMALSPRLNAEQALELGLVNRVVGVESFAEEVHKLALELAQGPTRTFGLIKQALRQSATSSLEEMLDVEAELQDIAGLTEDHKEGVRAFYEKRAPRFFGR
ncbi:MAG: 2-(1,2-epoxy-1,2-dihydrophenyl)acetyl-CoA isomerase [Armatimonadota bacterium]